MSKRPSTSPPQAPLVSFPLSLPFPPLPSSFLLRIGAAVERHKSDIYLHGGEREREAGRGHQTVLEGKAAKLEKEDGDDDGRS